MAPEIVYQKTTYTSEGEHFATKDFVRKRVIATPAFQWRRGLVEGADLGLSFRGSVHFGVDFKLRLMQGKFSLAVDPGIHLYGLAFVSELPIIFGFSLGEKVTLLLSPGIAVAAIQSSDRDRVIPTPLARMGLGVKLPQLQDTAILPEITIVRPFKRMEASFAFPGDIDLRAPLI